MQYKIKMHRSAPVLIDAEGKPIPNALARQIAAAHEKKQWLYIAHVQLAWSIHNLTAEDQMPDVPYNSKGLNWIKIGVSTAPERRMKELSGLMLHSFSGYLHSEESPEKLEKVLHKTILPLLATDQRGEFYLMTLEQTIALILYLSDLWSKHRTEISVLLYRVEHLALMMEEVELRDILINLAIRLDRQTSYYAMFLLVTAWLNSPTLPAEYVSDMVFVANSSWNLVCSHCLRDANFDLNWQQFSAKGWRR